MRAGKFPIANGVSDFDVLVIDRPEILDGGKPGPQRGPRIRFTGAGQRQMHVGIDQAGHEGDVAEIYLLTLRRDLPFAAERGNPVALHDDDAVLDDLAAFDIKDPSSSQGSRFLGKGRRHATKQHERSERRNEELKSEYWDVRKLASPSYAP